MISLSKIPLAVLAMAAVVHAQTDSPSYSPTSIDERSMGWGKPAETPAPTPSPTPASSTSGDPHFKTWTGEKFDYHGECDLVLIDNPSFDNGLGLKVHVRTTHIKYYSYIEKVAIQIGSDVLEFANDVENVLVNGEKAAPKPGKLKIFLADKYEVVRYKKAVILRIDRLNHAKIDLIARKIGWPSVKIEAGETSLFKGSKGLLGDYNSGKKLARDGTTEMNDEDTTPYALEWQVRDTEPMLFSDARHPQFPTVCIPPKKMMGFRLGSSHMRKEAEKACAAWGEDKDECIFDVMATRDMSSADELEHGEELAVEAVVAA